MFISSANEPIAGTHWLVLEAVLQRSSSKKENLEMCLVSKSGKIRLVMKGFCSFIFIQNHSDCSL